MNGRLSLPIDFDDGRRAATRVSPLREVFNGLRHIVRGGISWRMLAHDLPPWHGVYPQTQRWLEAGILEAMVHDLREVLRLAACPRGAYACAGS